MSALNNESIINSVSLGFRDIYENQGHHPWIDIGDDDIPYDEPCVFVLGGSGTKNDRSANGYAKGLSKAIANKFLQNVKIYGAVYNFTETYDPESDVKTSMIKNGRKLISDKGFLWYLIDKENKKTKQSKIKKIISAIFSNNKTDKHANETKKDEVDISGNAFNKKIPEPANSQLIEKLFNQLLLPRISENNKKLDINEAIKRIRNVTFVIHCYGGHVFFNLEELMQQKMTELGYTPEEKAQIQKQLFCIAFAPMYPLGKSKSTMLSFASAQDTFLISMHNNIFSLYINALRKHLLKQEQKQGLIGKRALNKPLSVLANSKNNLISYFPDKRGNIIIFPHIGDEDIIKQKTEHNLVGEKFGPNGRIFQKFITNAITNSIKSAYSGNILPNIKELVTYNNKSTEQEEILENIFEIAEQNGADIYNEMKTLKIKQSTKDVENKTHRHNIINAITQSAEFFMKTHW